MNKVAFFYLKFAEILSFDFLTYYIQFDYLAVYIYEAHEISQNKKVSK